MINAITVKHGNDFREFQTVTPPLIIVLGFYFHFCEMRNLNCRVTNITHQYDQSISLTHADGRAFDGSIIGWPEPAIDDCLDYMDENAGHFGAYSASDGVQRVVVRHDAGLGDHLHFQVKK